jgi:hypothetical protein
MRYKKKADLPFDKSAGSDNSTSIELPGQFSDLSIIAGTTTPTLPQARKRAITCRLHHSFSRQEENYVKVPFSKVFLVKRHFLFGITRKSIQDENTRFGKDRLACMGSDRFWAGGAWVSFFENKWV